MVHALHRCRCFQTTPVAAWQAPGMEDDLSASPPTSFHWERREENLKGGLLRENNQVSTYGLFVEA